MTRVVGLPWTRLEQVLCAPFLRSRLLY